MHPVRTAAILVVMIVAGAGAMAVAQSGSQGPLTASATLRGADGARLGTVQMRQDGRRGPVTVRARVNGMPPGFHGFHIHARGRCDPPTFESALGHVKRGSQTHGDHIGDLPVLLVKRDGSGRLVASSDRFSLADLRDADGSAVMVHAKADNYANIPTRYAPRPDQETLDTGDSGSRLACGAVR